MKLKPQHLISAIAIVVSGGGFPLVTFASGMVLEEIVVTSRKKEESVQTVPVSVTAISAAGIERAQIQTSADLQGTAPSVSMTTGSPGSSAFVFSSIRGQGAMNASVSVDPAVATYIDGVYIARPSQGLSTLQDLERIEVLRGPQGTLFGRNTTGGAINIITKNPSSEFEASVYGGLGSDSLKEGGVSINVPVNESTAFRINYSYAEDDGWASNDTFGVDIEGNESHMVNGKLRIAPVDSDWSLIVSGDYNKQRDTGQMNVITGLNPLFYGTGAPFEAVGLFLSDKINNNYYNAAANNFQNNPAPYFDPANPNPAMPAGFADQADYLAQEPFNELEAYGGSVTVEGDIAGFGFKSISAYRYSDSKGIQDFDGSAIAILASSNGYESEAISQEFQITGEISESVNFISGVYWSTEDGKEFSVNQPFGLAGSWLRTNNADITNKTVGAYVQGYWDISEKLRLSTGYRWTRDKREVDLHNLSMFRAPGDALVLTQTGFDVNCNLPSPDSLDPCNDHASESFTYPAWTLGLDYQLSEATFLYAKTSRASKAGGWNLRVGSVPAFDPEELTDIEIGVKSNVTDRLRVNASYFHSWVEGVQRSVAIAVPNSNPPVSTAYTVNAGDSQIDGIELEVLAALWENFELSFNGSWMDGEYDSGTFNEEQVVGGQIFKLDRSDEPLLQLPEFQFGLSGTQRFFFDSSDATVHLGYKWIDEQYYDSKSYIPGLETIEGLNDRLNKTDSYGLLYGSVSYHLNEPNVDITLWGRNLADKKYLKRTYGDLYADLGFASAWVGEPRSFGLKVTYHFE